MTVTVNLNQAKAHLSQLIDQAVNGDAFIISKSGKPLVKVVALTPPPGSRRLGFMKGQGTIPADIKAGFEDDIAAMFAPK